MITDPMPIASGYTLTPSIPAVSREPNKSVYKKVVGDITFTATISHQYLKGRRRTSFRLDTSQMKSDPYVTAQNVEDTFSTYLVIDRSERLTTDTEVIGYVTELLGLLALVDKASVETARLTQVAGGES